MKTSNDPQFNRYYELHCKHLKLKGLQPKTIDAYTRALRRIGDYFDFQVDNLSQNHLLDYFRTLLERLSWSAVKFDLYGLKFFYTHMVILESGKQNWYARLDMYSGWPLSAGQ
jgi:integrase/recombinase XerD